MCRIVTSIRVPSHIGLYSVKLVVARAYRAAEGGERACNARSPYVDGEIQHITKNNTSSHAREC